MGKKGYLTFQKEHLIFRGGWVRPPPHPQIHHCALAFELFCKNDYICQNVFRNSYLLRLLFIKIGWSLKRSNCRSSRSQMFLTISVPKNRNIHTKTPVLESRKKKETPTQAFSCEYCKIFKNSTFFKSLW